MRLIPTLLAAIILSATTAQAQTPTIQPRVVNTQHEELKKQADAAYRKGDFAEAIKLTDQVIAQNPNDHVAHYLRGSARVELGIIQGSKQLVRDGINDAREAIRIEGRGNVDYYLPYLYGMSNLTVLEGNPQHAETARDVAGGLLELSRVPTSQKSNIAYQRALLQLQLNDADAALADFEKAIEYDKRNLGAQLARCDMLAQHRTPDEAEQAFAEAVATFPDQPLVRNNRGMYFQSLGRIGEALADFNQAIELDAKYAPAYMNRGFTRMQAGDINSALADFSKSLEVDPEQPGVYSLRGTTRLETGDLDGALSDYTAAVQHDDQSPQFQADLGFARFFHKDYTDAVKAFDETLRLDPQARFLNPWRAASLLLDGNRRSAEESFASVVEKEAADRDWFDLLVLLVLGKVTDNDVLAAVSGSDEALADAQRCEAFYFIGLAAQLDGREQDAETFFRQALQTNAKHLSAYRGAQYALGDFSRKTASL